MPEFRVSVIIPVYNAAAFVTQAVESALEQPETAEVLLIEDGSPDNALEICEKLASKYEKVKLLRHPNGENRGAGASRNLGMKNAKYDYIAFLDADDYFLPARFKVAKEIFTSDPNCEGVYEAIGMHVEDELGLLKWKQAGKSDETVKMVKEIISPEELGKALISGGKGHFSLDGLVINNEVLMKSGYMDETLRIHQDTNFIIRLALVCNLLPGRLDRPVTMWRVHQNNRVSEPKPQKQKQADRMKFLQATYKWCKGRSFIDEKNILVKNLFFEMISLPDEQDLKKHRLHRIGLRFRQLFRGITGNSELFIEPQLWRSFFLFTFTLGKKV